MKILTNLGIVAGIHALVLLVILAPGCSSSKGQSSPADATPAITPASDAPAPDATATVAPAADASAPASILYSPTRPGTPAAEALETQPVTGVVPATTYTVVANDSLWSVAKKNHLKVSALAAANNLRSGSPLHVGQKLIIPAKAGGGAMPSPSQEAAAPESAPMPMAKAPSESAKYVVRPGETLGAIARKFHVKVGAIAEANAISDPAKIRPGQELVIPGGKSAGMKAAPAASAKMAGQAPEEAPEAAPAPVPAANEDLDAGLKPSAPADVPVVKVEDSSSAPPAQP
jgi:LysM repeat protein